MKLLYRLAIICYQLFIHFAALFHPKAKLWVDGRKNIDQKLREKKLNEEKIIWIHCASLGEFEQGRPLIEQLKKERPTYKILLTFYSPSGYEIRKNYPLADHILYLPVDTASNAKQFVKLVQPQFVFFIKYEFWYYFLKELKQQNIPSYLVAAVFRKNQVFFKWYGGFFRKMLPFFSHIFVQNQESQELLKSIGLNNSTIAGDTRIDRVLTIAKQAKSFPIIEQFVEGQAVLIAGSTWQADEAILSRFINEYAPDDWKFIIAPHEIKEQHIRLLEQSLTVSCLRYSQANINNSVRSKVLIIDNIGMLSALYQYGKVAYIGGGFGAGIHNTLEPIAFGLPVIFGPKYKKFTEANWLVSHQGGFVIQNVTDFRRVFQDLAQTDFYKKTSDTARLYIEKNQGATQKVLTHLVLS